jgi:hypothetical protein
LERVIFAAEFKASVVKFADAVLDKFGEKTAVSRVMVVVPVVNSTQFANTSAPPPPAVSKPPLSVVVFAICVCVPH